MVTRKDALAFAVFVATCLACGLNDTKEVDECFSWAIGEDWERIPVSEWRKRAVRRGIHASPDVTFEEFVRKVIEEWKRRGG